MGTGGIGFFSGSVSTDLDVEIDLDMEIDPDEDEREMEAATAAGAATTGGTAAVVEFVEKDADLLLLVGWYVGLEREYSGVALLLL